MFAAVLYNIVLAALFIAGLFTFSRLLVTPVNERASAKPLFHPLFWFIGFSSLLILSLFTGLTLFNLFILVFAIVTSGWVTVYTFMNKRKSSV